MESNKTMTLDKLAEMSQKEFLAMGKRFDEVDRRFDVVDKRFDLIDGKFDALAQILGEIRKDNKEIKEGVTTINFDYAELKTRIERLEKKVGLAK